MKKSTNIRGKSHIEKVNMGRGDGGPIVMDHVSSEDAPQSGGKKHHENIPPVRVGAKPEKGY